MVIGMTERSSKMRVLLIEDSPADVRLFREALRVLSLNTQMSHYGDGATAIASLESGQEPWFPLPDIVFLDLNMPRMNGFEVLEVLRRTPSCDRVPIVIFTCSDSPADRDKAAKLRADRYVRKPTDLLAFFATVNATLQDLVPSARPAQSPP